MSNPSLRTIRINKALKLYTLILILHISLRTIRINKALKQDKTM